MQKFSELTFFQRKLFLSSKHFTFVRDRTQCVTIKHEWKDRGETAVLVMCSPFG